jgi:2-polyprenyl-3-methyl-5-hydroxy-6-metoxy-1,4-benzoquinol methylase
MPRASADFEHTPIEAVQNYWNRRPCNIRHSPRPVGSREYFDDVEERKYLVEPHIPAFAEFGRWAGKRVLEIGCGIGTDTINFARAGAHVTAVDLSQASLEVATRRAHVFGLSDRVTFIHSNAETLEGVPLEPAYDLIYSFGVIHHTPHPIRVLEQARKRIAPDGVVKVMVYNRNSWKVAEIVLGYGKGKFWELDSLVARHSEAQTGCPVTFSYTRRTVTDMFRRAGFRVDRIEIDHIFPYRVKDYVEYRYVKRFPFNVLPERADRALEHKLGWHLCVTASGA